MTRWAKPYRASAWLVGFFVLLALGVTVTLMIYQGRRESPPKDALPPPPVEAPGPLAPLPPLLAEVGEGVAAPSRFVRGVVLLPDGEVAPGAAVTLQRRLTAWPEWRVEAVEEAITDRMGRFQFRVPNLRGYLLEFASEPYAGGVQEVAPFEHAMTLRLQPGFAIAGNVLNDVGAPVANAQVSIESVPGDDRRARVAVTQADGSYRFENVAAGSARMVARHESWQPVEAPAILIGERSDVEFRFERPTMAPLRGVVMCAVTQEPIVGARVDLIPIDQSPGLVAPISVRSGADGGFLVEGVARGSMRMLVRHPEHGAAWRTQAIGSVAQQLVVELPQRTSVEGRLEAAREGAFRGGEVLQLADAAGALAYAVVEADGSFAFDRRVSPGIAEVSVLGGALSFRSMTGSRSKALLEERAENVIELEVLPAPVVRGRFVDEGGRPLRGVAVSRVQQLSENMREIGDAARSLDLGQVGRRILRIADRDELLTVTGEDGAFEVRGFRPGRLLVRASCAGRGSRSVPLQMPAFGDAYELGDVVLARGCSVSGRVLRGGRPFVGATVLLTSELGSAQVTTDARGGYAIDDLAPGDYTVRAKITGVTARGGARVAKAAPDAPARDVDLKLESGRQVQGLVRNAEGEPLVGALVSVRGRPGEVSRTRGDGSFSVELPRRRAELIVSIGDRSMERVVAVAREQEDVEVRVDAPPTCSVRATVYGSPGRRRVSGVLMRWTPTGDDGAATTFTRWVPTPDGELQRSQVPSGPMRIELWRDGYAPAVLERYLIPNEENELGAVALERGATFRGRVVDEDGAPVAGASVLLGEEADLDLAPPSVFSAADGGFVIGGVTSRSRRVVVRHRAFAARTLQLDLPRDLLAPEPLPVTLERGGTIEVVVPLDKIPDNGLVFLRRSGRLLQSTVVDERGYAYFANRSAGAYSVKVAGSALVEREVVIAPNAAVTRLAFE